MRLKRPVRVSFVLMVFNDNEAKTTNENDNEATAAIGRAATIFNQIFGAQRLQCQLLPKQRMSQECETLASKGKHSVENCRDEPPPAVLDQQTSATLSEARPMTKPPWAMGSEGNGERGVGAAVLRQPAEQTAAGDPFTGAGRATLRKSRMCTFFASQKCTRGESCAFAHSAEEVQPQPDWYRTKLCRSFMQTGLCTNGEDCHYAHGVDNLRRQTWLNSGDDSLQQPEQSYRRYRGACSPDANENDALRRSQRIAYFGQRSACRTNAGSSPGLAVSQELSFDFSECSYGYGNSDRDTFSVDSNDALLRMTHAPPWMDVRVGKAFLEFDRMEHCPILHRVSSCPTSSLLTID